MTTVKLLSDGGYKGLEAAVGKTFNATKHLGHWNISAADLKAAGCNPCMAEYAFLQREVDITWHTHGL